MLVVDDSLRIALPYASGGDDNFVLGLAVDMTVDLVS
jgi:hypothetical protein